MKFSLWREWSGQSLLTNGKCPSNEAWGRFWGLKRSIRVSLCSSSNSSTPLISLFPNFSTYLNSSPTDELGCCQVPTKLVELGNALAWGGGIHGNPASGPHQTPSHWTIQWNTYRPILTSRGREVGREEAIGKNQSTKWHTNSKLF